MEGQEHRTTRRGEGRGGGVERASPNGDRHSTKRPQPRSTAPTIGFGDQSIFAVNIQNDGSKSDRFKLKAPSSGWKIKYFHGSTNITTAVVAGTYRTATVAPGASAEITVKVDIDTIALDATGTRLITITSSSDSTKKDAVKLKMKIGSCGC